MSDENQGLQFGLYVWRRRRLIALTCLTALVLTGTASLLLPRRYTANASILIDPPSGTDARTSVAVSQVYLDSLKTYEEFASGDTLFAGALDDLHLLAGHKSEGIEKLKRRILSVSRPVNATYIQVAVTLPDAKDAQRLAQRIVERTVALNNSFDDETNAAIVMGPRQMLIEATGRRNRLETAAAELAQNGSFDALQKEYNATADLRTAAGHDLEMARANLANYLGELQAPAPDAAASGSSAAGKDASESVNDVSGSQSGWIQFEVSAARSRVQDLEAQEARFIAYLDEKGAKLEEMQQTREALEAGLKSARADEDAARARLGEIEVAVPLRGTRLRVLDAGIVPQQPSFPNIPLNVAVAMLASLLLSLGYLALCFANESMQGGGQNPHMQAP